MGARCYARGTDIVVPSSMRSHVTSLSPHWPAGAEGAEAEEERTTTLFFLGALYPLFVGLLTEKGPLSALVTEPPPLRH